MDKNTFSYLMRRLYDEIKASDVDEAYETFMLILDLVFIDRNTVPRFFQELLDKDTLRMFDDISLVRYKPRESICKEGSHDYSMFVIVSGTVRISKKPAKAKGPIIPMPPVLLNHLITKLVTGGAKTLSNLSVGDFFGESALFSSKPNAVSAVADSDVEVIVITTKTLQKAMTVKPNLCSLLREYYVSRLDSMVEFLHKEQSAVQSCAFGALLGNLMPDDNNGFTDTAMMLRAESNEGDALPTGSSFSITRNSAVENGLYKVIKLYSSNRKVEAALLYISIYRMFFKEIATFAANELLTKLMNSVREIRPLYEALDKLQCLIPASCPQSLDEPQSDHGRQINFLALFNDLLRRKLNKATELQFSQGQTIINIGEAADSIYVVKSGSVKVYPQGVSTDTGDDGAITTIGQGGVVGYFDFFNRNPRTTAVIAAEDASLYELNRQLAAEMVKEYPEVLEFFKKEYEAGIVNLIKEANAIKAYYESDLVSERAL